MKTYYYYFDQSNMFMHFIFSFSLVAGRQRGSGNTVCDFESTSLQGEVRGTIEGEGDEGDYHILEDIE